MRRQHQLALLATLGAIAGQAQADANGVKIGVLTDMSGVYSAIGGKGAVTAVQMAVDDFGGQVLGKPIKVVSADHQNKADIGVAKAREWFDTQGVDMVVDLLNSSVGIGVQKLGTEKKRIVINNGSGSTALTNKECSPYGVHYTYDTFALANGTGRAMMKTGARNWFFLTADYAFGQSLEKDTSDVVREMGGKVVGTVRHPLSTSDFSSYLLQAQGSGANVVALANAGADFTNAVKQAREFGIMPKQTVVGMLVFDSDIASLGLATAQGMKYTTAFYWDLNNDTRAFSQRYYKKTGAMPTMVQAGDYSSTMHYLKAVKSAGTVEAGAVMAKMRTTPINDFFARNGKIREDGRMVHDMYLVEVKKPADSKNKWDMLKVMQTIPGAQAFMPLSRSECPLVKKS
ncbi:ABC transporter substrate-binding protein [Microvirgula curvata]